MGIIKLNGITYDGGGGDECYQQWDRVLKTYNQAIQDLFNAIR